MDDWRRVLLGSVFRPYCAQFVFWFFLVLALLGGVGCVERHTRVNAHSFIRQRQGSLRCERRHVSSPMRGCRWSGGPVGHLRGVGSVPVCVDRTAGVVHKWSSSTGGGAQSDAGGAGIVRVSLGGESARYVACSCSRVGSWEDRFVVALTSRMHVYWH